MKRILLILLLALLLLCYSPAAQAATEYDAAAYLVEHGVYQGDQNGNLHLYSGLTRAELAAILTRVTGGAAEVAADPEDFAWDCYFDDVPQWAKPYVGYCARHQLMQGYSLFRFGAQDAVNPAAACTVLLRYLGYPETDWSYATAGAKAVNVGIAASDHLYGAAISRGHMAVLIYRSMLQKEGCSAAEPLLSEPPLTKPQPSGETEGRLLDGSDHAREDFSQAANPTVFNSVYTRAAYNAIRQTMLDRDAICRGNADYDHAHAFGSSETKQAVQAVLGALNGYYSFATDAEPNITNLYQYPDYFIITVSETRLGDAADEAAANLMAELSGSSQREQVVVINQFVCERLSYESSSTPGVSKVLAANTAIGGNCSSYASAFRYLCSKANIPCLLLTGQNHAWNLVYTTGGWSYVDCVANDLGDEIRASVLLKESYRFEDAYPEKTAFGQELLVPGSTR